jgi:O-acetyl-ADP-ribose deacetylase (regulator of RNase III)
MSTYTVHGVTLTLLQGNIVDVKAEAIVNAANTALAGGGGVDGAIHRAAGPSIMAECRKIGSCPTGSAAATNAGNLKARYIFHAVGPIYQFHANDAQLLANAYQACLNLAEHYQIKSIAFPSLSTGAYGYPINEAAPIAFQTVLAHIKQLTSLQEVIFVLFGERAYRTYEKCLQALLPVE